MLFIGDTYTNFLDDAEKGIEIYEKAVKEYPKSEAGERALYRIGISL
ncbi:MAG: tetratricopeptide repeat protein, partial [Nitrospinae bacterium]|nr:tetratricopeptide repeat protein [Nitrospinota bacterium]